MSERVFKPWRRLLTSMLVVASSCQPPKDTSQSDQPQWHDVVVEAPGAMLAMWTSSEGTVWAVGAARDVDGPMVLKRERGNWVRLLTGLNTNLWWVHGFADGAHVVMAGDDGAVVDYTASDGRFEYSAIDNAATVYGLWGATSDDVWFVGRTAGGDGLIARRRFGLYQEVAAPSTVPDGEAFFKVWGTAANHLLIIGERGTILRWDGAAFTHDNSLAGQRLVTIHGRNADDMAVVGGLQTALIFEGDALGLWTDVSPPAGALLNGVFVAPDGHAAAAGFLGAVFERVNGAWTGLPYPETFLDWHAAHIDARGDIWVVGGNLLAASSFDSGALLRFGPPRADDGGEGWTRQQATVVNAPTRDAMSDSSDDGGSSTDTDTGPSDALGRSQFGDFLVLIGAPGSPSFRPLPEGADVEIVQGPQGGIHGEVMFQVSIPTATSDKVVGAMQATIEVGGELVGYIDVPSYPVASVASSSTTFESSVVPIFLVDSDAASYAGQEGRITVRFTYLGKSGSQSLSVRLVDEQ